MKRPGFTRASSCHFANFSTRLAKYSMSLSHYLTILCGMRPSTLPRSRSLLRKLVLCQVGKSDCSARESPILLSEHWREPRPSGLLRGGTGCPISGGAYGPEGGGARQSPHGRTGRCNFISHRVPGKNCD